MIKRAAYILAACTVLVAAAACGGGSSVGSGGHTIEIKLTEEGCNPATLTADPGRTTFHVKNDGANSVTEFEVLDSGKIIGEKENLTPGLEGSVDIDLKTGTYTLACPGGTKTPTGTLTVGAASGSSDDHHSGAAPDCVPGESVGSAATKLNATLSDFKIELNSTTVAAGPVQVEGTNNGQHPHEIVVVKGVASNALPTDANGAVDEDKLPSGAVIGEFEAFSPGRTCDTGLNLTSGSYTLFCNVQGAEEGSHFRLGMVTTLVVS